MKREQGTHLRHVGAAGKPGIEFRTGPFRVLLRTAMPELLSAFRFLYGADEWRPEGKIRDFHIEIRSPGGFRRWWRPQACFFLDGSAPFEPFPRSHAFPLFEWGLNYAIATRAHQFCLLHSAVLERNGRALILPALPGSGKSTLCAALMHRGWRLFSDEFGIVRPETGLLLPMPRVIPLKNRSIEVIRRFAPEAVLGPVYPKTRKGDVAHVAPTRESLERQDETAPPAWIVFPRYLEGAECRLESEVRSRAFVRLSNNSFNYHLLGETAFRTLTRLVQESDCHQLVYSDLEEAVAVLNELAG